MRTILRVPALLSLILFFCVGCANSALEPRVAKFAAALGDTSSSVSTVFDAAQASADENRIVYLTKKLIDGVAPEVATTPIFPAKSLALRLTVLESLSEYATLLSGVVSPDFKGLGANAQKVGAALSAINVANFSIPGVTAAPSADQVALIDTAIYGFGRILIEAKLARDLPLVIDQMQPIIEKVCELLLLDFGAPSEGDSKSGLLLMLEKMENRRINGLELIFLKLASQRPVSSMEALEYARLLDGVRKDGITQRAMIVKTAQLLRDLPKAHGALRDAANPKNILIDVLIDRVSRDASEIAAFYQQSLKQ